MSDKGLCEASLQRSVGVSGHDLISPCHATKAQTAKAVLGFYLPYPLLFNFPPIAANFAMRSMISVTLVYVTMPVVF